MSTNFSQFVSGQGFQSVVPETTKQTVTRVLSGSSGASVSRAVAESIRREAEAQQQAQAKAQADAQAQAQQQAQARQQAQQQAQAQARQQQIIVRSGTVKIGNIKYIGGATVPGTGMTANQYGLMVRQQAVQQGLVKQESANKYTYRLDMPEKVTTGSIPIETKSIKSQSMSALPDFNLLGNIESQRQIPGATIQDYGVQSVPTQRIYAETAIEKRQTGTFKDSRGRDIPITGTFLIEPPGKGGGVVKETQIFPSVKGGVETYNVEGYEPITLTEDYKVVPLSRTQKVAQSIGILPEYKSVVGSVYGGYETASTGARESFTDPTLGRINFEKARTNVRESTEFLISKGVPSSVAKGGEFISGIGLGVAEDVRYKPLKYAAIYGATAGVGFGVSALTTGATAGVGAGVGGLWGAKAGVTAAKVTSTTLKVGAVGAGVGLGGLYAKEQYSRIVAQPTALGKGQVFGVAALETGVGFAGFKGGSKLYSKVDPFTRIKEVRVVRPTKTPEFVEKSYSVISKGKEIKLADYQIFGEKTPPIARIETTAFRKTFGMKPLSLEVTPAKYYSVKTIFPAINQRPFLVSEFSTGSKMGKVRFISGSSQDFNIKTSQLTSLERFTLQRYAQNIAGKPISQKNLPKFFQSESDFAKSTIQSRSLFNINMGTKKIKLTPYGKSTTTDLGITRTTPLYETDSIRVFTSESFFKDISKPFARATGKTPKLTGTIYQLKEPIVLDTGKDVRFIQPRDITKTPFSKTFQEAALVLQREQLPKLIPKPSRIPFTPKVRATTIPGVSEFSGLGLYELSGEVSSPVSTKITQSTSQVSPATFIRPSLVQYPSVKNLEITKSLGGTKQLPSLKQEPLLKQQPLLRNLPALKQQPTLKQEPLLRQQPKLKQAQKVKLLEKLKLVTKMPTTTKKPYKPFGYRGNKTTTGFPLLKGSSKTKQPRGLYPVLGRRFGKFKVVGVGKTQKEAFSLGKKFASKTLGVTFKVPGAKAMKLPGYKTKLTKEGVLYIEPRGKRLKKGTKEVPEIQYYKKVKGGRKKRR